MTAKVSSTRMVVPFVLFVLVILVNLLLSGPSAWATAPQGSPGQSQGVIDLTADQFAWESIDWNAESFRWEDGAIVLEDGSKDRPRGALRVIELNQTHPLPVILAAESKAEDVPGDPDVEYSLWADVKYADGSPGWGAGIVPFSTGTHDWEYKEVTITPTKPIKTINLHVLLRRPGKRVWFRNVTLQEDELQFEQAGQPEQIDLHTRSWIAHVDEPTSKISLKRAADGVLTVDLITDGGSEDFPKIRLLFTKPQDWTRYTRLRARVRFTSNDTDIVEKKINFVFYDENTRLTDYPGRPMKQQGLEQVVPSGEWLDLSLPLTGINRQAIRQFDVYLYETPPSTAYDGRWEFALLRLEGAGSEEEVVFDGESYLKSQLIGERSAPIARVTSNGLELQLCANGQISDVVVDGRSLAGSRILAGGSGMISGLLVRDVQAEAAPVPVGGTIKEIDGIVQQSAQLAELGLEVNATYKSMSQYIEVAGTVSDLLGRPRAITVTLALPVMEGKWKWWDSITAAREEVGRGDEFGNFERGANYGANGIHSRYPLGAISLQGNGGLSLAVRMDEPVVHRIAYNPWLNVFYISVDFGLVPEVNVNGKPLWIAPFRFVVYQHDPAWGFRSALERYYAMFPQFFEKRVPVEGGWYVWKNMADNPAHRDAGFAFHWGPPDPWAVKWDNANNVLALNYIEPELYQQTMGDWDHAPTRDESLLRLYKLAAGDREETEKMRKLTYAQSGAGHIAQFGLEEYLAVGEGTLVDYLQQLSKATLESLIRDASGQPMLNIGQFPWIGDSRWAAQFPTNLDPDIPGGLGRFNIDVSLAWSLKGWETYGARIDGFALDSLGYWLEGRADYDAGHFKYADIPLSFSPLTKQPVIVAPFATVEWLRELASLARKDGRFLMANSSWTTSPSWLTFAAPYLDIFGAENRRFPDPDYIRTIAYRKPATDLPYTAPPDWEVAWHLLHDIYPGDGNKLEMMERYTLLLHELSAAGWDPVTYARVTPGDLRIERYGSGKLVYLVVHNPRQESVTAKVTVESAALGLKRPKVTAIFSGEESRPRMNGNEIELTLGPLATVVLRIEETE